MVQPLPGDWFVTPTKGARLAGKESALIRWGQGTKVDGRWVSSRVNHAGIYVGEVPGYDTPQILEAQPGGSRFSDWDSYPDATWSTGRLPAELTPTDAERGRVVAMATAMLGIPYGFLDYAAITLAQPRFGQRVKRGKPLAEQPWWVRRIASMHTAICSQLVVEFERAIGINLIGQGLLANLVTPQDLAVLIHA